MIYYTISLSNIHLESSFELSKDDFVRELLGLRERHPESQVWNRSIDSLKREWAVHNAFHALGILLFANGPHGPELAPIVVHTRGV